MPRPTCASALWPARSSKPWPAIPTGTLPMRRRGGIISGGSASPTWRSIRSASPPKARCGGRSRGCCPTPCPTTVRARGLVLGPCRAPSSTTFTDQQYAAQQRLRAGLVVLRRSQGLSPRPTPAGGAARPLRPDLPPPPRVRHARPAARPAVRQQGRVAARAGPSRGAAAHQRLRARSAAAGDQAQDLGRNPLRSGLPRRLPRPAADLCQTGRLLLGLPRTPPRSRPSRRPLPARPRQAPLSPSPECPDFEGVPEERWISSTFPPNSPRCLRQGQVTEAWLDFLVDMQVGDQGDRSVDHLPGSGNDTGAAADPGQPVAQAAVRAFESDGLVLAGIMPAR